MTSITKEAPIPIKENDRYRPFNKPKTLSYYKEKEEAQLAINFSEFDERMEYYGEWIVTSAYDPSLRVLADRHYSRQTPGSPHISRPGYKLALRTSDGKAGWLSWRGKRDDGLGDAWECSFYRNENKRKYLSSTMIKFGVYATYCEWKKRGFDRPQNGYITYVDPTQVNDNTEAGYSYIKAGFKEVGKSKKGKIIFKIDPYDNILTILELQWIEYFRYIQKVIKYLLNADSNDIYYLAAYKIEVAKAEKQIEFIRKEMKKRGLEEALYHFKPLYILTTEEMDQMIDSINYLSGEGDIEDLASMYPLHELYNEPSLIQKWKW